MIHDPLRTAANPFRPWQDENHVVQVDWEYREHTVEVGEEG